MKRNRRSRILVLLLAICLLLAFTPAALAETSGGAVAKIERTGKTYPSIKEAVDEAKTGDTVTVIRDHVIDCNNSPVELQSGVFALINAADKAVTLDLNGMSITGTVNFSGSRFILFSSSGTGHLTLKDSKGGASVNLTAVSNVYALMMAYDSSSYLTVESGSYQVDKVESALVYSAGSEKVTINGGTFRLGNVGTGANGSPWIFNASGRCEQHVVVNGGTFNADVFDQYWIFEAQGPETKALVKTGSDTWTMMDAVAYTTHREKTDKWYNYPLGYITLKEAVAAADQVGRSNNAVDQPENVILLTTCPVDDTLTIDKSFKIDLNGKSIKWEGNDTDPMFSVAARQTLTMADFTPIRDGYSFAGWYSDADRTNPYNLAAKGKVEGGTDLYAKWNAAAPAPIPETGDHDLPILCGVLALISLLGLAQVKRLDEHI